MSQEASSKTEMPDFNPVLEAWFGGMEDNASAIDGMILAWNTYVVPLQSELSSIREENSFSVMTARCNTYHDEVTQLKQRLLETETYAEVSEQLRHELKEQNDFLNLANAKIHRENEELREELKRIESVRDRMRF